MSSQAPTPAPAPTKLITEPTTSDIPTASVSNGGNLRSETIVATTTVIGQVCPGDQVAILAQQKVGAAFWYKVRLTATAADCNSNRVAVGTEGWLNSSLVSQPSVVVADTSTTATPIMDIRVTSSIVKFVGGKHRYFFSIRNHANKPFIGSVTIQLMNSLSGILGEETFTTKKPINSGVGTAVYFDIHTGPQSIHGAYGVETFHYEAKVDDKMVASGDGLISDKYESLP